MLKFVQSRLQVCILNLSIAVPSLDVLLSCGCGELKITPQIRKTIGSLLLAWEKLKWNKRKLFICNENR